MFLFIILCGRYCLNLVMFLLLMVCKFEMYVVFGVENCVVLLVLFCMLWMYEVLVYFVWEGDVLD